MVVGLVAGATLAEDRPPATTPTRLSGFILTQRLSGFILTSMQRPTSDIIDQKVQRRTDKGDTNTTVGPCMHCGQDIPLGEGFQGTRGNKTLFEHVKITTADARFCATTSGVLVAEAKIVRGVPDSNGFTDTRPRPEPSTQTMAGAREIADARSELNL